MTGPDDNLPSYEAKTSYGKLTRQELNEIGRRNQEKIDWFNRNEEKERLAWMTKNKYQDDLRDPIKGSKLAGALYTADVVSEVGGRSPLLGKQAKEGLKGAITYSLKNLAKSYYNLKEGRRPVKHAAVLTGLVLGVAAAVVISVFALPALPALVGGIFGAGLGAGLVVGIGALVTTAATAFMGTYLGKKIGNFLQRKKSKSNFKIFKATRKRIQKLTGLNHAEQTKLHAYLINRQKSASPKSGTQKALLELDARVFKYSSESGVERLCYYLIQEYKTLQGEYAAKGLSEEEKKAIERDLVFVKHTLETIREHCFDNALKTNENMPQGPIWEIEQALGFQGPSPEPKNTPKPPQKFFPIKFDALKIKAKVPVPDEKGKEAQNDEELRKPVRVSMNASELMSNESIDVATQRAMAPDAGDPLVLDTHPGSRFIRFCLTQDTDVILSESTEESHDDKQKYSRVIIDLALDVDETNPEEIKRLVEAVIVFKKEYQSHFDDEPKLSVQIRQDVNLGMKIMSEFMVNGLEPSLKKANFSPDVEQAIMNGARLKTAKMQEENSKNRSSRRLSK